MTGAVDSDEGALAEEDEAVDVTAAEEVELLH
jgi:hypothetical protein